MTLITISHLPDDESSSPPSSLQFTDQSNCALQHQQHSEVDRFSLNSNLSDSSPHSSLASPLSTEYNGSQASICYTGSSLTDNSNNNHHQSQDHDHEQEQHHERVSSHNRKLSHHQSCLLVPASYNHRKLSDHHRQAFSLTQPLEAGTIQPSAPVRRLSRTEHRQSLSDLGYGKIESYAKLQRLGKGTYATVYMGRSRLSNDLVALKEILKEHDEGAPCTAIREVSLLRLLRHNNIVTLHDICHTPKKLTLVFEYVGPDLYAYMKENNHLLSIHNVRVSLTNVSCCCYYRRHRARGADPSSTFPLGSQTQFIHLRCRCAH